MIQRDVGKRELAHCEISCETNVRPIVLTVCNGEPMVIANFFSWLALPLLVIDIGAAVNGPAVAKLDQYRLAPPLKHWVYELPSARQTHAISVVLTTADEAGKPVPGEVLSFSQP